MKVYYHVKHLHEWKHLLKMYPTDCWSVKDFYGIFGQEPYFIRTDGYEIEGWNREEQLYINMRYIKKPIYTFKDYLEQINQL